MPMILGLNEIHIIGKALDAFDPAAMTDAGLTEVEQERADQVFNRVDDYLTRHVGRDWDEKEVL